MLHRIPGEAFDRNLGILKVMALFFGIILFFGLILFSNGCHQQEFEAAYPASRVILLFSHMNGKVHSVSK